MEVSQYDLARMLLAALLCGLVMGVLYDALRLTRMWMGAELPPRAQRLRKLLSLPQQLKWSAIKAKAPKNKKLTDAARSVILFVEDVLFCLAFAIMVVLLLYKANDGQLRLSAVVVLLVGLTVYLMTLGRLVRYCSAIIVVIFRAILIWSGAIFAYPFAWLIQLLMKWTAPMRAKIKNPYHHYRQQKQRRKQARLSRVAHKKRSEASAPRPTNGKHYFSKGGQTTE